ncbi:DUF3309 domain-containing protein [Seohaeicola zhoushanensis]|uniref:DUF3309 domain-containing protein n=1 Tax=Seohaeicola zhoushanensis TaxID=1569283 RepID=UPI001677FF18|nr:DUF3309 domain-containing protein [Seohaeicola zhoushanensis]
MLYILIISFLLLGLLVAGLLPYWRRDGVLSFGMSGGRGSVLVFLLVVLVVAIAFLTTN